MGAVQILRLAVAAAVVGVGAGAAHAVAPTAPIAIAVVDLRADADDAARLDLLAALRAAALTPVDGPIATALTGRDLDLAAAMTALAEAQDGFGQLDCGRARPSAEAAARLLVARMAAGLDERARLAKAWAYVALCAERDGDRSGATFAVDRLRGLGVGAGALPADAWARYPVIDAAIDRDIVELTVTGPAGSIAWVDDRAIGATPATTYVAAGKHVIAVAAGSIRGATIATSFDRPLTIAVEAAAATSAGTLTAIVQGWQAAGAVDAAALADAMTAARAELAVVIDRDGHAALWQRTGAGATLIVQGSPAAIATAAHEASTTAHDRAPAAEVPLLRDGDVRDGNAGDKAAARWWVYAAIGGAIAAGAVVIYAVDAGDDRQRFELRF